MIPRTLINAAVIFVFVTLVGYSVAQSLKYESFIGFILALTSLGAAIYFIYLMAKAKHAREDSFGESETEETSY
jgi:uncharacterized membrane protein